MKFEYHVVELKTKVVATDGQMSWTVPSQSIQAVIDEMNALGEKSWELVSVTSHCDRDGIPRSQALWFKRPKA